VAQDNAETVSRFYDALSRGDLDEAVRLTHPEFAMTTRRPPTTHRGRDAARAWAEDYLAAFEYMLFEPDEFLEKDDQVLGLLTRRARPKGGSGEIVVRNGHLWTIRDGGF